MAGTVVADTLQADSTSTLVIKNGVANTPPTIQDSAGTQIGTFCRAWANWNGTTVTNPASMTGVRASFNVSSILDNGAGNYTVNLTTAMPDTNYICVFTGGDTTVAAAVPIGYTTTTTTSAQTIRTYNYSTGSLFDCPNISIAIFR